MCGDSSPASESHAPSVDYKTVKKGSKGEWVRKLQEAPEIQVDGRFASDTDNGFKSLATKIMGLRPKVLQVAIPIEHLVYWLNRTA